MKTEVDKYRGWEIYFDTDKEGFTAYSNAFDHEVEKPSYSSIKKSIDDFVKANEAFKPFFVVCKPDKYGSDGKRIKIIGIRKDMRFIYEDKDGKKCQFSSYGEDDYFIEQSNYKDISDAYNRMMDEIDAKRKAAAQYLDDKFKGGKSLTTFKKELFGSK